MSIITTSAARTPQVASATVRWLSAIVFAVVVLAVLAPRGTVLWLPVLALAGLLAHWYLERAPSLPVSADPVTLAFLAFAAYCAANALWSLAPNVALAKVATLAAGILATSLMVRVIERQSDSNLIFLARALAIGTVIGTFFIFIEVLSDLSVWRTACTALTALCPSPKHMVLDAGVVKRINPYNLNRNVGALNLVLWPGLLAIAAWPAGRVKVAVAACCVYALALVATLRSEHETSMVAILASAAIFALCRFAPRLGRAVALAGWTAATLLVVPVALVAYDARLYCAPALPSTAQARIVLWGYTAKEVIKNPLFGVGVNSTPEIDESLKAEAKPPEACAPYPSRTGQHSHNIYMQSWFELGLAGVLFLYGAGFMAWRSLCRLPTDVQPFAFATATSAMCVAAFSWGMWQAWYLYLFALAAILLSLAARWAIRRPMAN